MQSWFDPKESKATSHEYEVAAVYAGGNELEWEQPLAVSFSVRLVRSLEHSGWRPACEMFANLPGNVHHELVNLEDNSRNSLGLVHSRKFKRVGGQYGRSVCATCWILSKSRQTSSRTSSINFTSFSTDKKRRKCSSSSPLNCKGDFLIGTDSIGFSR